MAINHRQLEMFRAGAADLPEFFSQAHRDFGADSDVLRVAKIKEQVVAGYAMSSAVERQDRFRLDWIAVLPDFQRRGVGRWVAGHALGVAESKSGRGVRTRHSEPATFFQRLGFTALPDGGFCLDFLPE